MADFLSHYVPDNPGEIVNTEGEVLGNHRGLHLYTLGQRKGHGVASPREGVAYVVVGKDAEKNQLVVGWDHEDTLGLYVQKCTVGSVSWVNKPITSQCKVEAQPRYRAKSEPVTVTPRDDGKLDLKFVRSQRAITPGQICAFYDGGTLLGGGVFENLN